MATFEQHVTIDASIEQVWALMINPQSWGQWFPDADQITGLESITQGATFQWQEGTESGTASITEVDTDRGLIKVVTTKDSQQTTHTFDLDKAGGFFGIGANDTKLLYKREYHAQGGIIGEFVAGGNPMDARDVKQTIEKIKRLAQG
ncbi:MAG: SRPBCC family protein [Roseiflexaceae bacterium]|nr:SRPBCC family protein [Roseiflexaceae bacterium]